ncbi:hypothetical protein LCGC14_2197860, partial [marine sediment metagenome]
YGISKYAQDMIARLYHRSFGLNIVITRAFNITGAGRADVFVDSSFAKQIAQIEKGYHNGVEPIIRHGNLESERDFISVHDVIRGYILALRAGKWGEIYCLGTGNPIKIKELLEKIGIPNNSDSLPNSCLNYKRYIFLYEFFNLAEMKMTVGELEAYPNGRKYNQAEQITFHTNLSPIDIVEKMSDNSLFKKQEYFIRAYSLDKDLSDRNIENFRSFLKEAMIKRGEGRTEDLWADPFVWGEKIKAEDDDICDSKWEKNIDDFLFHNNILHEKPQSARFDQYYFNRKMYPDWIVNGVMIELFGATYLEGYEEKIEYKKENNKMPLISISKEDYENNLWENKLRRKLDFLL